MRQFMQTLPSSLIDAARVDACSEPVIFWKIILPLSRPALAVLGIFTFIASWNAFLWPLVATNTTPMRTLQVGLVQLRYQYGGGALDYGMLMAGASLAAVPVIIVFLLFQRYFMEGLTIGARTG
jgi:multiple sugar transport system permease protein